MELIIEDRKLRKLCEDAKHAQKRLGDKVARRLQNRLSDLAAADSLFDLPATFHPHALKGDREGQFAIKIDAANRIVFVAADEPVPRDQSGAIHWPAVRKIRIVEIGDYHD